MRLARIHLHIADEKRAVVLHAAAQPLHRRGIAVRSEDRNRATLKKIKRGKSAAEGKVSELGESLEEFFLAKVGSGDDFALADFLA